MTEHAEQPDEVSVAHHHDRNGSSNQLTEVVQAALDAFAAAAGDDAQPENGRINLYSPLMQSVIRNWERSDHATIFCSGEHHMVERLSEAARELPEYFGDEEPNRVMTTIFECGEAELSARIRMMYADQQWADHEMSYEDWAKLSLDERADLERSLYEQQCDAHERPAGLKGDDERA